MPLYVVMSLMALMSLYGCGVDCEAAAKGTEDCLGATPTVAPGRMLGDDSSDISLIVVTGSAATRLEFATKQVEELKARADAGGRSLTDAAAAACKRALILRLSRPTTASIPIIMRMRVLTTSTSSWR
jgi:hypothetical protein